MKQTDVRITTFEIEWETVANLIRSYINRNVNGIKLTKANTTIKVRKKTAVLNTPESIEVITVKE